MNAQTHDHRRQMIRRIAQRTQCVAALERRLANPGPITPNVVKHMTGILATLKKTGMWPTSRQMKFVQRHGTFMCLCGAMAIRVVNMTGYCKLHQGDALRRKHRNTQYYDAGMAMNDANFRAMDTKPFHMSRLKTARPRLTL